MVIGYPCSGEVHRLRVSAKGRIRLLDYDEAHQARDVVQRLAADTESTCTCFIRFLHSSRALFPASFPTSLQHFSLEITKKRRERRDFTVNLRMSPLRFEQRVLQREAEAAGFPVGAEALWNLNARTGREDLFFDIGGTPVFLPEFRQCRRLLMAGAAAVLSKPMGFVRGDLWYLPCSVEGEEVRLLCVQRGTLVTERVSVHLETYHELRKGTRDLLPVHQLAAPDAGVSEGERSLS
jgi:hypothetical protein